MKKILIATTALVATAGVAAADVSFGGYGRFGVLYNSGADNSAPAVAAVAATPFALATPAVAAKANTASKTTVETRFRFHFDASKETDSGVTFGGRVRMQYDDGTAAAALNAANLYASYNGLKVTVGNVGGAYDDSALMYNSEVGLNSTSNGDPSGTFYAYNTGAYSTAKRMGVNVAYSIAGFAVEASYINPDQTVTTSDAEVALTASYKYNQITVSAATAQNGGGVKNNDLYFVGAEFAVNDMANVGVLYFDNGDNTIDGRTITLYGNYKMDALTLRGYVANNDKAANSLVGMTKTSFGVGADYDLGGATLLGGIERNYAKDTTASMGVKFSF